MADFFTLSFDPASLAQLAQMYSFPALLSTEMQTAMSEAGDILVQAAQANTDIVFANPTGVLKSTIQSILDSPYEVQIGSDSPYARRREYGFSGMTDSLGRTFANDPAKPYMQPALDDNQNVVLGLLDEAIQRAWVRISGGG